MVMRARVLFWSGVVALLGGCTPPPEEGEPKDPVPDEPSPTDTGSVTDTPDTQTTPETTGDTGLPTETGAEVLAADCQLTDNPLRIACTATLASEDVATLELVAQAPGVA